MVYQDQEDRKDCINYAIMDCILCWENFDTEKSKNPFAYFTQVCKNGFVKQWKELGKKNFPNSKMIRIDFNQIDI